MAATAKQLAALKKARAARKRNLAAKKPVKKKPVRKAAAKKPVARKTTVSKNYVVIGKKSGKAIYLVDSVKALFDTDKDKAKRYTAKSAKSLIDKLHAKYGVSLIAERCEKKK